MVEVVVKSLRFLVEGARTNWFGLGCPAFCVQPSVASIFLAGLLGLLAGIALTLWALWTFHNFGFSFAGPVPPPSTSRYSVLAEYLNEHSSQSRRRRSWPHLPVWRPPDFNLRPGLSGHWSSPLHHLGAIGFYFSSFFSCFCCSLLWFGLPAFCWLSTSSWLSCTPGTPWHHLGHLQAVPWLPFGGVFKTGGIKALWCWPSSSSLPRRTVGKSRPWQEGAQPKSHPAHRAQESFLRDPVWWYWLGQAYCFQLFGLVLGRHWKQPFRVPSYQPRFPEPDRGSYLLGRCRRHWVWHQAVMMEQMDGLLLTLADLVTVSDALEPYALTFQPDGDLDGTIETYALVVMKRAGGVLLAVPSDAIPQELLDLGESDTADGREWH